MTNGVNGHKVYSQVLDYYTDYVEGGTSLTSLYNVRLPKVQVMVLRVIIGSIIMLILTFIYKYSHNYFCNDLFSV